MLLSQVFIYVKAPMHINSQLGFAKFYHYAKFKFTLNRCKLQQTKSIGDAALCPTVFHRLFTDFERVQQANSCG